MVRPEGFEPPTLWFVAKCSIQLSYGRDTLPPTEILIIAETLPRMKESEWLALGRTVITLIGPKYFLFHDFNKLVAPVMPTAWANVNLSHPWQFLLCAIDPRALYFQAVGIGKSDATIIGRRSGAQRGALEDKLRPEVFLDAPLHFSFF